MTTSTNKPTRTLRDGSIKATIWCNDSDKGPYYSVQFARGYTDQSGQWHDTDSFSGTDLLKLQHLAGKAYDAIAKLRDSSKANGEGEQ